MNVVSDVQYNEKTVVNSCYAIKGIIVEQLIVKRVGRRFENREVRSQSFVNVPGLYNKSGMLDETLYDYLSGRLITQSRLDWVSKPLTLSW